MHIFTLRTFDGKSGKMVKTNKGVKAALSIESLRHSLEDWQIQCILAGKYAIFIFPILSFFSVCCIARLLSRSQSFFSGSLCVARDCVQMSRTSKTMPKLSTRALLPLSSAVRQFVLFFILSIHCSLTNQLRTERITEEKRNTERERGRSAVQT